MLGFLLNKFPADLVTFTEEIPHGKLHFLCGENQSPEGVLEKRCS